MKEIELYYVPENWQLNTIQVSFHMTNFGFILLRINNLRFIGRLIDHVHKNNNQVSIFFPVEKDEKTGEKIDTSYLKKLLGEHFAYFPYQVNTFREVLKSSKIDVLAAIELPRFLFPNNQFYRSRSPCVNDMHEQGVKLVSIGLYYDTCQTSLEILEKFSLICYFNEFCLATHKNLLVNQLERDSQNRINAFFENKTAITGTPIFDNLNEANKKALRLKYNIPSDKKVVLLLVPFLGTNNYWYQQVWGMDNVFIRIVKAVKNRYFRFKYLSDILFGMSFSNFVEEVRKFCDYNNAILIAKTRSKNKTRENRIVEQFADRIYSDETPYPVDTTTQLLAMSDLVFTTRSAAIMESIYANTPVVQLKVPLETNNARENDLLKKKVIDLTMSDQKKSTFKFEGCITTVSYKKFPKFLKQSSIENIKIDQSNRNEYLEKFVIKNARTSSERIYQAISKTLS